MDSISKFVKFSQTTVHRSQLKNAPYNPRNITDKARKKLKENIKRVGLVEPPIWNRRTGNIVGGHQRVAILDSLEGTSDYYLPVAEVDLDEKTEKEQNIFLNNGDAQGDFDLEKLDQMFREHKEIDFDNTGFSVGDIYQIMGDSPLIERPEQIEKMAEQFKKAKELYYQVKEASADTVRGDYEYYLVVVFRDNGMRANFLKSLGIEDDHRYVDGRELLSLLNPDAGEPSPSDSPNDAKSG